MAEHIKILNSITSEISELRTNILLIILWTHSSNEE